MSELTLDYEAMLEVAIGEARVGLAEGGIPIGAAVFGPDGRLVSFYDELISPTELAKDLRAKI